MSERKALMGMSRVVPGTGIEIYTAHNGNLNIYLKGLMMLTVPEKSKEDFLKVLQEEMKKND